MRPFKSGWLVGGGVPRLHSGLVHEAGNAIACKVPSASPQTNHQGASKGTDAKPWEIATGSTGASDLCRCRSKEALTAELSGIQARLHQDSAHIVLTSTPAASRVQGRPGIAIHSTRVAYNGRANGTSFLILISHSSFAPRKVAPPFTIPPCSRWPPPAASYCLAVTS